MPRSIARAFAVALLVAIPIGCALDPDIDGEAVEIGVERAPIVGGEPTEDHPAVVQITRGGAFCSGTLIGPRTILTAGHCANRPPPEGEGAAYFGADSGDGGPRVAIERVALHAEVDLALLTLSEPAPADPMPFYTGDVSDHMDEVVTLVGFGVTDDLASDSGLKRQGWSRLDHTTDTKVYTGYDDEGAWVCHGDSGGPVFLHVDERDQLVGVVSTGAPDCGTPPNGHVRVDAQQDWIGAGVLDDSPDLCAADGACTPACPDWFEGDPDCQAEPAGCASSPAGNAGPWVLPVLMVMILLARRRWRRLDQPGKDAHSASGQAKKQSSYWPVHPRSRH
jgi:MYXO-CTERM domain-containing protein